MSPSLLQGWDNTSLLFSSHQWLHRSGCTLRMLRNTTSRGLARWGEALNLHPLTSSYSSLLGADISFACSIMEGHHSGVSFTPFLTQFHHKFIRLQMRAIVGDDRVRASSSAKLRGERTDACWPSIVRCIEYAPNCKKSHNQLRRRSDAHPRKSWDAL